MKKYLILGAFLSVIFYFPVSTVSAFSSSDVVKGETGNDVIELQARLQNIGYYQGKIDGIFGYDTYWSLRNFQKNFGMGVTGIANLPTKTMLEKASHYNEAWVMEQIRLGNEFTYYQGVPIEKQVKLAPAQKKEPVAPAGRQSPPNAQTPSREVPVKKTPPEAPAKQPVAPPPVPAPPAKQPEAPAPPKQPAPVPPQAPEAPTAPAPSAPPVPETPAETPAPAVPVKPEPPATATNESVIPAGYTASEIKLLSNAVYGESRGEPYEGQVAVAAVILNRVESPSFPNTVSGVIYQPGAFVAVSDGQINLTPNETAKRAVIDAINGWDPAENAIYYFNPDTATNQWIWGRPQIKQIGKHIFCR